MAKRKILALLAIAVVCCLLMVSCPQDPDALPKGVYRLIIKGGTSLEKISRFISQHLGMNGILLFLMLQVN